MSVPDAYRLEGLEPDNLLAFLALLGLLRALEASDRALAEGDALRPRVFWDVDHPPLRPALRITRKMTRAEIAEAVAGGASMLAARYDFGGRSGLDYSRQEARELLMSTARAAGHSDREHADLLSCLFSDAALKEDRASATAQVMPTPLCLLFGQGHQHFLDRLARVPNEPVPPPRGRGKSTRSLTAAECISEALFEPWQRKDPTVSFRWDPEEASRWALLAGDPTDPAYKAHTQHGANRLAALGIASITLVPEPRAGRTRAAVIGGAHGRHGFSFAWPIWTHPTTLAGIHALLSHRDLRNPPSLEYLGVAFVLEAKRISVSQFMNFGRARALG